MLAGFEWTNIVRTMFTVSIPSTRKRFHVRELYSALFHIRKFRNPVGLTSRTFPEEKFKKTVHLVPIRLPFCCFVEQPMDCVPSDQEIKRASVKNEVQVQDVAWRHTRRTSNYTVSGFATKLGCRRREWEDPRRESNCV